MGKLVSLKEVNASILPANVLVLLSKYAQAMRTHTGLVIKISSLNVFKHVHNTNKLTENIAVRRLYRELLLEVNNHISNGSMQTNDQRELLENIADIGVDEEPSKNSYSSTGYNESKNYFSVNL